MPNIPQYSLVIFPSPDGHETIKGFKQHLKNHIDWFGSANAAAHVTVINFKDDSELTLHLETIREFCSLQIPHEVTFDSFQAFEERTFFVAPENNSQTYLNQLISDFHNALKIKPGPIHAHMSIARGLDAVRMKKAFELFSDIAVNLTFVCNAFYLRKYNQTTKQYSDIVEKFEFHKD